MIDTADYRRARLRTLPYRLTLTPAQLAYIAARIQRAVGELNATYDYHIPENA